MGGGLGGFVVQGGPGRRGVRYSVQNGIRPLTLCSIITHMLKRRASLLKNRAFIQGHRRYRPADAPLSCHGIRSVRYNVHAHPLCSKIVHMLNNRAFTWPLPYIAALHRPPQLPYIAALPSSSAAIGLTMADPSRSLI